MPFLALLYVYMYWLYHLFRLGGVVLCKYIVWTRGDCVCILVVLLEIEVLESDGRGHVSRVDAPAS